MRSGAVTPDFHSARPQVIGVACGIRLMSSFFGVEMVPGHGVAKTGLLGLTRASAFARRPRS